MNERTDEDYMAEALKQAQAAAEAGEVPVGCVIVRDGAVIGRAHNMRETLADPTAHAEMIALTQAAEAEANWRLDGVAVYCTLEPCTMCAGALVNARVERLVFGLHDQKSGACGSLYNVVEDPRLNHRLQVRRGVMAEDQLELLRQFFEPRRGGETGDTAEF